VGVAEVFKVVIFLLWCNFLPPLANLILGDRLAKPLDGDYNWLDGRPLFGHHKTWRGLLFAVSGGTAVYPVIGTTWQVAMAASSFAMAGDLLSSFIKRRLGYQSGDSAPLLDQLFECLLPLLYLRDYVPLSWLQIGSVLLIFVPLTYIGSRFWHFLLFRPPLDNYPRLVRSAVRFREWRACHEPFARWRKWLYFENVLCYRGIIGWFFKATGIYQQGIRNALDIKVKEIDFASRELPVSFDNFRILYLVDLHLDALPNLTDAIIAGIKDREVDLCIIGGDIRMEMYGPIAPSLRHLRRLMPHINSRFGKIGVLGNHDCIEMVPDLEDTGIAMLINDAVDIAIGDERIWLVGVDDPHYYRVHDVKKSFRGVPENSFVIFLAHSPEAYREAEPFQPQLYLCGHTHGGQIRMPGRGPLFTHSRAARHMAQGFWRHRKMQGYTSCGVGVSGVPLRFNCPGEITLITLRAAT